MKAALALLLASGAWAAVLNPGSVFDGKSPGRGALAVPGEAPALGAVGPLDTEVPEDIAAARPVWGTEAMQARLAASPSRGGDLSFAVIGDAEPGRFFWERWFNPGADAFARQLDELQTRSPELVIQLGDFVSRGIPKNYRKYLVLLAKHARLPIFHAQGNHDRSQPNGPADKNLYRAVFGPGDYFVDRGAWRLVVFDSSDYAATGAQLDWLDSALDTERPTMVFMHIPPVYLKGLIKSVEPPPDDDDKFLSGWFEGGSGRFREILSRRKVRRVYMGHIHAFGVAELDGTKYVLTAGGGSPLYPLPPGYPRRRRAHYIRVEAGADGSIHEMVRELDGTEFPIRW
ncbi:MAG: metallophosphoesterase [Elusimicrobia bacterium]|nr:metallophosphoesterase [Elusimicrobiota bacterium]